VVRLLIPPAGPGTGFSRPWAHLERLLEGLQVRELAFGAGYLLTGRTPAGSSR
jgi:hypothetical protein